MIDFVNCSRSPPSSMTLNEKSWNTERALSVPNEKYLVAYRVMAPRLFGYRAKMPVLPLAWAVPDTDTRSYLLIKGHPPARWNARPAVGEPRTPEIRGRSVSCGVFSHVF